MPTSANKVKLGELLIDAGIITSGDLTEAIQVSRRLGVPIGQALLVSRCVTDSVLEAALEAQPLVKNGTISRAAAVDALRKTFEDGTPLRLVLDLHGETGEDSHQTSQRLAELLLDSEIVNQDQVEQAMMTSFSSGMPLGSALVLEGVLSPSLFPSILRIQRNIREGRVGREEGINELRSTFLHWIKAEESLARAAEMEDSAEIYSQEDSGAYQYQSFAVEPEPVLVEESPPVEGEPRLIDLLRAAGAISHEDVQAAFERVLDDPVASGKLFKLLGLADDETIRTAQRSLNLFEKQLLTDQEAVNAIKTVEAHAGDGESSEDAEQKPARDKKWKKSTATKVLGGIAVGAAVAGISSLLKRPKR